LRLLLYYAYSRDHELHEDLSCYTLIRHLVLPPKGTPIVTLVSIHRPVCCVR
jgi:hypothetical protein